MRMDRYNQESKPKPGKKHTGLKVSLLILLLLIIAALGTGAYKYKTTLDSLKITFLEENPEVEFGTTVESMAFVHDSVGEVTPAEVDLNTDEIGSNTMSYIVSKPIFNWLDFDWVPEKLVPSKEFTLDYTVVDSQAPVILWNGTGSTIQVGSDFDLDKYFGYGDNADPTPTLDVSGKVNTKTAGDYTLKLSVTDASGNETKTEMTITVAESIPEYSYDPELTSFDDFVKTYEGDGKLFGIDVSTWQGDIDFAKVKAAGAEFVIIRIGYSVDGEVSMDSKFEQNYKNAKAAGLKIGIYLYSYDNTEEEVRKSADWIVETLAGDTLDLPVVFDWEDFGEFQSFEMSFTDLNSYYDAFADQLAKSDYETMLYGSKNFLEKVWEDTDTRAIWLAHYTDETDYVGPYRIWQASQTGKIDGIDGAVDLDIMYE